MPFVLGCATGFKVMERINRYGGQGDIRCWSLLKIPYFNLPRIDAPGAFRHIVIRGFERKAIFKDDTDREDFIERLSRLLQEMDADAIGRYRSLSAAIAAACRYLGIEEKELARPTRRVEIARARALISYVAMQILSISGSEVARRFNVDRSAISRATQRVSRDPELPAAIKTIQKELELETNQHRYNVPLLSSLNFAAFSRPFLMNS